MTREIYAWVGTEPDLPTEGIVMVSDHVGNPFQLVTSAEHEAKASQRAFREELREAARRRGAPVRLIRYVEAEVVAEIHPEP
jgi:hypothetical protein